MKLTPKQLRQIIKEELSTVLVEGSIPHSPLPEDLRYSGWSPGNTTDYWQRLYNVQDGVFTSKEGDRIPSHQPPSPVVKFVVTDTSEDFGAGKTWNLVVSGGHRRTEARPAEGDRPEKKSVELMPLVGNITNAMGTDPRAPDSYQGYLVRRGIPANELANAVKAMQALLSQHRKPRWLTDIRPDVDVSGIE
jgi:hypothetical protein